MTRNKDIDGFLKDAKGASKIVGSNIPIIKDALSAHDAYKATSRLSRSAPKAVRAVKNEARKRIRKQKQTIKRKLRLR